MAKEDLVRKACPIIENRILGGDEKYLRLLRQLLQEELMNYSNPELREIIGDED